MEILNKKRRKSKKKSWKFEKIFFLILEKIKKFGKDLDTWKRFGNSEKDIENLGKYWKCGKNWEMISKF